MAKKYYDRPPKEGMVKIGYHWVTEEEADKLTNPTTFDPSIKEICRMYKHRGPYVYIFQWSKMNDDGDEHFIMCSRVRRVNNKVKNSHTLIRKDLSAWINSLISRDGNKNPIWSEHYQDEKARTKKFELNLKLGKE